MKFPLVQQLIRPSFFIVLVILVVAAFWRYTILLIGVLLMILYLKHRLLPIHKELIWFVITGLIGAFGESLIMLWGPWSYASATIFNFPLWLPFVWGMAGCVGISLYKALEQAE